MGVGNAHDVQNALNATVFAVFAVQGVEHDVGLLRRQRVDERTQIARQVQFGHVVARLTQRFGDVRAACQRNFAFGRQAAH